MHTLVAPIQALTPSCVHSPHSMQRCVYRGSARISQSPSVICLVFLMLAVGLMFPLPDASLSFCCRHDAHVPRSREDAHLKRGAVALFYENGEMDGCADRPCANAISGVLMAHAATADLSGGDFDAEADGTDVWGTIYMKTKLDYDSGLKPFLRPWREVRDALRDAGCFSTLALPRLTRPTGAANPRMSDADTDSPTALPSICRKPLVLISARGRSCSSCTAFSLDVLEHYRAEWEYIRAYVTLVDAGDPMTEQLVRYPYPLWYNLGEVEQWVTLERVSEVRKATKEGVVTASGANNTQESSSHHTDEALSYSDAEDFYLFNQRLRHKATHLLQSPTVQATHMWSRLVKSAFAGQSEYMLRIIFAYPHNGSVMRDVVNEEVTADGSRAEHLHFFTSALPFFHCVKKAVRIMEWLQRYGDY
ncbi:hypothetical protein JKF63_06753 [Porcisia hertigi]|uniref:Uncharacterized protein n=1 Tax=Porcisia hertigi TaxID=2761500 RepID=A0A836IZE2_9TRYP|nr:hypothetical protein JKF63_06753 [Porcisia hertigi]